MHFIRQPFQDGIDTAFFYTGGTRQEIVDELISVIAQRVPFMTMTGDEGSGKTVICRMLEENLPADLLLLLLSPGRESLADLPGGVSGGSLGDESIINDATDMEINLDDLVVPRTLESFDDMVSIIFEQVVGRNGDDAEGTDTESILDDIVKSLRARGKRLLIIFDEAEKIYLAPLERLRRLLDQVNEESVIVQMLFSGRPLLTENFEQLSIVTFKEIEERHFVLQPLDREATLAYLNHCMEIGTGEERAFFSAEMVDRIFSVAKGNFTKINRLAREYLKAEKLDTKFITLLNTHQDIEIEPPENRLRRSRVSSGMPTVDLDFLKLPSFKPQWLLYGGGICAIVLLVLLLFGRSSDESKPELDRPDVPVLQLKNVEPRETAAAEVVPDRPVGGGSETSPKVEMITVIPPADVPVADSDRKNLPRMAPKEIESRAVTTPKEIESRAVTTPKEVEPVTLKTPKQVETVTETKREETVLPPVVEPSVRQPIAAVTVEQTAAVSKTSPTEISGEREINKVRGKDNLPSKEETEAEKGAVLQAAPENEIGLPAVKAKIVVKPLREKKEPQQPGEVTILENRNIKLPMTGETVETPEPALPPAVTEPMEPAEPTADEIYRERLVAGTRWLIGQHDETYTVQLMVLASDQAEAHLIQMLDSEDYRSVADKLYVLRRLGALPTVKLFYGEYKNLAAARKARNTLPLFLRDMQPFAVAIPDAVEGSRTAP